MKKRIFFLAVLFLALFFFASYVQHAREVSAYVKNWKEGVMENWERQYGRYSRYTSVDPPSLDWVHSIQDICTSEWGAFSIGNPPQCGVINLPIAFQRSVVVEDVELIINFHPAPSWRYYPVLTDKDIIEINKGFQNFRISKLKLHRKGEEKEFIYYELDYDMRSALSAEWEWAGGLSGGNTPAPRGYVVSFVTSENRCYKTILSCPDEIFNYYRVEDININLHPH